MFQLNLIFIFFLSLIVSLVFSYLALLNSAAVPIEHFVNGTSTTLSNLFSFMCSFGSNLLVTVLLHKLTWEHEESNKALSAEKAVSGAVEKIEEVSVC